MQHWGIVTRTLGWATVRLAVGAALGIALPAAGAAEGRLVRTPLAVVDSVQEGMLADLAGVAAGDLVVDLAGLADPDLQTVSAHAFERCNAEEADLVLERDGARRPVTLAQGNWRCELRPDLETRALERLEVGRAALAAKDWERARGELEALAVALGEEGAADAACWLRLDVGRRLAAAGEWERADAYLEPLAAMDDASKPYWRFSAALEAAEVARLSGRNDDAPGRYERAVALADAEPSGLRRAAALSRWMEFEYRRGRLAEAKRLADEVLAIRERAAPGSLAVAAVLTNLGSVASNQGEVSAARDYHSRAVAIFERLAPGSLYLAAGLNNMGGLAWREGDLPAARDSYLRALALFERLMPDSLYVAVTLGNLGAVAKDLGDLSAARRFHLRALEIEQRLAPESTEVAGSLQNLGVVAQTQGDLEAAREYHLAALELFQRLAPGSQDEASCWANLGTVAYELGDLAMAREHTSQALAIREREAPGSFGVAACRNNLGELALEEGDLGRAREQFDAALAIRSRLAPASLDASSTLHNLGRLELAASDLDAARTRFGEALAIRERLAPASLDVAESWRALAGVERASGNLSGAITAMERSLQAFEAQRSRVGGASSRATFVASQGRFYSEMVELRLAAGDPWGALVTLERSRARSLLELLAGRKIEAEGLIPAELGARRDELERRRVALADNLARSDAATDPAQVEGWRSELLRLPVEEDALAEEVRRANPRLAALEYPRPLERQGLVEAVEPGTLLLAFSVGERETVLFSLLRRSRREPVLDAVRLPVGERELRRRVQALRLALTAASRGRGDDDSWRRPAEELFRDLLAPAAKSIARCRTVLLLPDGPLHQLPFGVLLPGVGRGLPRGLSSDPLGVQRPLRFAPSVTVYRELEQLVTRPDHGVGARWVGFGDPRLPSGELEAPADLVQLAGAGVPLEPLPGTRREVERVAALVGEGARVFLGEQASEAAVRSLDPGTSFLHFACHALASAQFPMSSALVLSAPQVGPDELLRDPSGHERDGLLQAWEVVEDLRLDADCVVLSACSTGLGREVGGEGILGFTRAFFFAGARSVAVSLWPVADESTAALMERFYREVLAGSPRDVALQRAQSELAGSERYGHPFHWATFQLHGRPD